MLNNLDYRSKYPVSYNAWKQEGRKEMIFAELLYFVVGTKLQTGEAKAE
jgi:hypothetical protein